MVICNCLQGEIFLQKNRSEANARMEMCFPVISNAGFCYLSHSDHFFPRNMILSSGNFYFQDEKIEIVCTEPNYTLLSLKSVLSNVKTQIDVNEGKI